MWARDSRGVPWLLVVVKSESMEGALSADRHRIDLGAGWKPAPQWGEACSTMKLGSLWGGLPACLQSPTRRKRSPTKLEDLQAKPLQLSTAMSLRPFAMFFAFLAIFAVRMRCDLGVLAFRYCDVFVSPWCLRAFVFATLVDLRSRAARAVTRRVRRAPRDWWARRGAAGRRRAGVIRRGARGAVRPPGGPCGRARRGDRGRRRC